MAVSGMAILVPLGHDAQRAALADAHASAHDDAVHESDIGLAEAVNQMVERIFLREEIFE